MPHCQNTIPGRKLHWAFYRLLLNLPFVLAFALGFAPAFSQKEHVDSVYTAPLKAIYKQYVHGAGGSLALYSGAEYEGTYPRTLGSPFWNNNDFQKGSIAYGGILYEDVPLAFELVRNEVLIKGFQELSLRLEKSKIDYFVLAGHRFVHLSDTIARNAPADGFYELLYDRDVQLYARRSKAVAQSFHAEGPDSITSHTTYFLHKAVAYYAVTNANDLQAITGENKKTLNAFWKEAGLNFKKDPELFITQTLDHWLSAKK